MAVGGDRLVEVVRSNPATAAQLIKSVSFHSALGSALMSLASVVFLAQHWERCGGCDRPLRWWLFIHAVMQAIQLPVRVGLYVSVRGAEAVGQNVEACVSSVAASPAWRLSKTVALVQSGWLVLGLSWWMHTGPCGRCPGASRLTAAILCMSAVRAAAALFTYELGIVRQTASEEDAGLPSAMPAAPVGASDNQVAALPVERISVRGGSCSICLGDYSLGDFCRKLPCGHEFHQRCVDKWLHRSRRCPLCMQDAFCGTD
eukprot:TRINITY_DN19123_c0_g1_i1.p1 TRINITY_DN19123_c0_g1~~TRINITY_DN19123_c0_g1_i1.p1  ORF type:complete len:259 (+),score=30.48 TRINITY_DN19123_c0_g1_i1:127-903(+)